MDILSKDTTQEFALAVIIGEAFYELIQKFTTSTVTPTMRAMFTDPSRWMVETVSGGILLTKGARYDNLPDNATVVLYASVEEAVTDGAWVLDTKLLMDASITFIFSLLAVHWLFSALERVTEIRQLAAAKVLEIADVAQPKLEEELRVAQASQEMSASSLADGPEGRDTYHDSTRTVNAPTPMQLMQRAGQLEHSRIGSMAEPALIDRSPPLIDREALRKALVVLDASNDEMEGMRRLRCS